MDFQIIHIVLGKANTERMNGVNKVVNSLATYQTKLGYNTTVWGITKNPIVNFPKRVYKTELFRDRFKFILTKKMKKKIKNLHNKKAVFHIHGGFIPQFYLVVKQLIKYSIKYVYTVHGAYNSVAMERSAFKKKIYTFLFENHLVKNAKYLHFIGESEVAGAKNIFNTFSYKVIPNGQNEEELNFKHESLKTNNNPIFGFVGRIDIKTKGLDLLLLGFAKYIKEHNGNGNLWIIGDGDQLLELKNQANQLNIQNNVTFFGSKYGTEKLNLISNMNYLCLTSRNEGLPGVVLEAAGLSIPCIISKETNLEYFIKVSKAGFCLPENTVYHIAKSMFLAAENCNTKKDKVQGRNAYIMIKEYFNWRAISEQIIQLYV